MERELDTLAAGLPTRAVARELNVHFSKPFPKEGNSKNLAAHSSLDHVEPRQPRTFTSSMFASVMVWAQPPPPQTAGATIALHNHRISTQAVRNRSREAHLHPSYPHGGLHLTAVRRRHEMNGTVSSLDLWFMTVAGVAWKKNALWTELICPDMFLLKFHFLLLKCYFL